MQACVGAWGQESAGRAGERLFLIEIFGSGSNPKTSQISDGAVRHNDGAKNLENICT
jgi:hypothetical protein